MKRDSHPYTRLAVLWMLSSFYPRLGHFEKIWIEEIDLRRMLRGIWEAKLLGMMGKQPDTPKGSYCRRCRWKKYCSHYGGEPNIPVGTLDRVPRPVYLLFAQGLLESGYNLDLAWMYRYISSMLREAENRMIIDILHRSKIAKEMYEEYAKKYSKSFAKFKLMSLHREATRNILLRELVSEILMIDPDIAEELVDFYNSMNRRIEFAKQITQFVRREFADDLELWSKATSEPAEKLSTRLGSEIFNNVPVSSGLPRNSSKLVKPAWDSWKKT